MVPEFDAQTVDLEARAAELEQVTVDRGDLAEVYRDFPAIWDGCR